MRLLRRATLLALIVSAAIAAIVSATATASANRAINARLAGTFTMKGRITVANNVYGEHVGQHVRRTWTFYPQCSRGPCKRVVLKRLRSKRHVLNTVTLNRQGPGVYSATKRFWIPLECDGRVAPAGGAVNERITVRITRTALVGGTRYATGISAAYHNPSRYQYTRCPGNIGHDGATYHGSLAVKTIAATPNAGYLILSAAGSIFHFGPATSHGDESAHLPFRRRAVSMAVDPATGGYWILNSNGSIASFDAPNSGSLAGKLHHTRAVAIAADPQKGYLILTSDGAVHAFGGAKWRGSDHRKLGHGVSAVSVAANAAGAYWILTSNGGVHGFGTPAKGSMRGKLAGHQAVEIAADPSGGYLILTSDGGVHPFGGAKWDGSDTGKLRRGVRAISLAVDQKSGGYWLLKSNGGVDAFDAPSHGSLK